MNWDDLRVFLAVRRHGSHAAAGRALGVDPTTVGRRVAALEGALGARLFRRDRGGLVATDHGVRLGERAELIESEVLASAREVRARGRPLDGLVRVSAADGVNSYVLVPAIGDLLVRHPGLRIEFCDAEPALRPCSDEAHVVVTSSRPRDKAFVSRRLGAVPFGLFASEVYLARRGRPTSEASLAGHALITYEPGFERLPPVRWLTSRAGRDVRIRCHTASAAVAACVAGQGIALAIAAAMREVPGVVPVLPRAEIPPRVVWGTTRAGAEPRAQLKAVLDWMAGALAAVGKAR